MQTSLKSRGSYYRFSNKNSEHLGFSLIELLISLAIIGILSTVVILRFSSFDSATLLKSLAYEIATSVREAQVYSVSVVGGSSSFRTPYGMSFTPDTKEYVFFRFTDPNENEYPTYTSGGASSPDINRFAIGRSMYVSDVCIRPAGSGTDNCSITRLDISFRRPEFTSIYYAEGYVGDQTEIESAKVKLQSLGGSEVWVVEVGYFGDITVYPE